MKLCFKTANDLIFSAEYPFRPDFKEKFDLSLMKNIDNGINLGVKLYDSVLKDIPAGNVKMCQTAHVCIANRVFNPGQRMQTFIT